jgi:hypothetical protein
MARVSGKVTYKGEPMKGGGLFFTPLAASAQGVPVPKQGLARIQSDGSYTVGTYAGSDGAVIGKHRVRFACPPPESRPKGSSRRYKTGDPVPKSPYEGLVAQPDEVEVKAGANTFNFKLVPPEAATNAR